MTNRVIFANEYFTFDEQIFENKDNVMFYYSVISTNDDLCNMLKILNITGRLYKDGRRVVTNFELDTKGSCTVFNQDNIESATEYAEVLQIIAEFAKRVKKYFIDEGFTFET